MSQKFKFSVEGRTFVLQGNQAQLLHHLMDVFSKQDVFVDCLWEAQWEDGDSKNGKPSNGFMMLGHRALYLFPCGVQSSISSQPYIRIPCSKIQHLEREDGIVKLVTSRIKSGAYRFQFQTYGWDTWTDCSCTFGIRNMRQTTLVLSSVHTFTIPRKR